MIQRSTRNEHRPHWHGLLAAAALTALSAFPLAAAELDRNQPANIESDRAELERDEGISRYFGDVEFVQGNLRITADQMVITAPDGTLQHAEAEGEPARVFDITSEGEELRARGQTITYDAGEPRITLIGSARVERGDDDFSAGRIRYYPDTGRVEGERDENERVRITIQPDEDDGEAQDDEGAENGDPAGTDDAEDGADESGDE